MSVWYCIPSKRSPQEAEKVLKLWRERRYKIALWRDAWGDWRNYDLVDYPVAGPYPGYAQSVNTLALDVLKDHPDCDWIVTGGDDVEPDLNHSAEEIARQCLDYFSDPHYNMWMDCENKWDASTFGVMQPSGDRWGDRQGAYIDRVCGSPWMGREWCLRINQGRGPLWPNFKHMFVDECLQAVATKLGVLWQRRDLIHYHHHWARKRGMSEDMPDFLAGINTQQHWKESKAEFERLKASNFEECMPLI
jgi:hypothetical protein